MKVQKCTLIPLTLNTFLDLVKVFNFSIMCLFQRKYISTWNIDFRPYIAFLKLFLSPRTFKWTMFHCSTPILIFLYKGFWARPGKIFDPKGQKDPGLKKFWKKITRVLGSWVNSCGISFDELQKSVFFGTPQRACPIYHYH